MSGFDPHLRSYFAGKRRQLLADVPAAGVPHSGLAGSHRETLIRNYLSDLIPRRFEIGRGMVFGLGHRSREADVVVWDAANYPALRLADHQLFFGESSRVVIESKSRWSANEFRDILDKCRAVRDIVVAHAPNLADDIAMIQLEVQALKEGREHSGMLIAHPHIATAAFVFMGGQDFAPNSLDPAWIDEADDAWPDVMILLDAGVVVGKSYTAGETPLSGSGRLEFWNAGDDSLLVFSAALLTLVNERSVQVEDPSYLSLYIQDVMSGLDCDTVEFRLSRPLSARVPLWHRVNGRVDR